MSITFLFDNDSPVIQYHKHCHFINEFYDAFFNALPKATDAQTYGKNEENINS